MSASEASSTFRRIWIPLASDIDSGSESVRKDRARSEAPQPNRLAVRRSLVVGKKEQVVIRRGICDTDFA